MIVVIPQPSPKRFIYISTVYLDVKTFKTEASMELLPENMFIFGLDVKSW